MDNGHVEVPDINFEGDFKLCYDEVHMTPGTNNFSDVGDHMVMSRKAILILSDEYLKSDRHRR